MEIIFTPLRISENKKTTCGILKMAAKYLLFLQLRCKVESLPSWIFSGYMYLLTNGIEYKLISEIMRLDKNNLVASAWTYWNIPSWTSKSPCKKSD